jgi:hypothetical protein
MVGVDIGLYAENSSVVTPRQSLDRSSAYKPGDAFELGNPVNSAALSGQFRE